MPPEAKDVPLLMKRMLAWIEENQELPCPLLVAIVHYQFATIHPYYDGNGRTAKGRKYRLAKRFQDLLA